MADRCSGPTSVENALDVPGGAGCLLFKPPRSDENADLPLGFERASNPVSAPASPGSSNRASNRASNRPRAIARDRYIVGPPDGFSFQKKQLADQRHGLVPTRQAPGLIGRDAAGRPGKSGRRDASRQPDHYRHSHSELGDRNPFDGRLGPGGHSVDRGVIMTLARPLPFLLFSSWLLVSACQSDSPVNSEHECSAGRACPRRWRASTPDTAGPDVTVKPDDGVKPDVSLKPTSPRSPTSA